MANLNKKWLTSFFMQHTFISSGYSDSVDLMKRHFCDVAQLNEVWVPQNVVFAFNIVFGCRIESSADGISICKCRWFSELPPCFCVLEKLGHL